MFLLGAVRERIGNGRQYVIEWSDGQLSIQTSTHIFGPFTRRHPVSAGDYVLAIAHLEALEYLPGRVADNTDGRLTVEFCDGSK